ncbi:hypothetical protein [Mammaliicoccus sciuri]|uniref:hypothetical protein n=1 Tax=Mammaliicoccus sciuri TaxID=1296 RepID=UPI000E681FFD|nr:hypothetical protein [Mammaliicoccus sciuri]RIN92349.1 hypothetical protein BU003_01850 [Mammaliicoccus sciuri]
MNELENKILNNVDSRKIDNIECLNEYFINIEKTDDYTIDFAALNKVEIEDKVLYEVETHTTVGVIFKDEVTLESLVFFKDAWLEEDQSAETHINDFYFDNKQDAKDYIFKVLEAYKSFEDCAIDCGIVKEKKNN